MKQKSFKKKSDFFWWFKINTLSLQNISEKNGNKQE